MPEISFQMPLTRRGVRVVAAILVVGPAVAQTAASQSSVPSQAQSPLVVVRDTGGTVPAGQYLSFALEAIDSPEVSPLVHFPVVSTKLAAGDFLVVGLRLPNSQLLPQPIFVIGDDERSKAWLKQWSRALVQLGALGFVVNATDREGFKALMRLADGVRLSPSDGAWFQDLLVGAGATTYPLIVFTNGQIAGTPARAPINAPVLGPVTGASSAASGDDQ